MSVPLAAVARLSPGEALSWSAHLHRYPGEWATQWLLALLCCLVARMGGDKASTPATFAPWLADETGMGGTAPPGGIPTADLDAAGLRFAETLMASEESADG